MREYSLDCRKFIYRSEAHGYIAQTLGFPDYYGKNLDALSDCLSELSGVKIRLENRGYLCGSNRYAGKIIDVFKDAADRNPNIILTEDCVGSPLEMPLLFDMDRNDYGNCVGEFVRPSARGIIFVGDRLMLVHSKKHGYYKFPGGGIEYGESNLEALAREISEEIGRLIIPDSVRPFGMVHRAEKGRWGEKFIQDNYYYTCCLSDQKCKGSIEAYEAEDDFEPAVTDAVSAIAANRRVIEGGYDFSRMLLRDNRVLEILHGLSETAQTY